MEMGARYEKAKVLDEWRCMPAPQRELFKEKNETGCDGAVEEQTLGLSALPDLPGIQAGLVMVYDGQLNGNASGKEGCSRCLFRVAD